ncbi:MAG: hypothetical protein WCI42_02550 [Verrucomicrobiota bacterium]
MTKNRWFLVVGLVFALILASVPSVYHSVKNARSEKLLAKSGSAFAVGDAQQGISLLKQALALSPGNLSVQHAVEIYNARSGDADSRSKLIALMRAGTMSSEELMSLADLETRSGEVDVARETIAHLPKNMSSEQSMRVALIEAALLAHEGNAAKAAEICLSGEIGPMGALEKDRLRTQGALYLLGMKDAADRSRAVGILMEVVNARTAASLTAWRIMTKLALTPSAEASGIVSTDQLAELVRILPSLSGTLSEDRLLAADLEIKTDPSSLMAVVDRLKEKYRLASRSELLGFARWLNLRQLSKETLALSGPDRPRDDTDWLLIVLDAECSQGNWKKVAEMLDFPSGGGMPVAVRYLYLARSAMMTGNDAAASEYWRKVSGALYLEKPETLAYIAGYEEQIGAFDRAARTYRELANREQTKIPGLVGLIRSQPGSTPVETMIPLYEELLVAAPENGDVSCDLSYLMLLAKRDIQQSALTAEKLLEQQPNSLARISVAALARLRLGNVKGAMDLYSNKVIDWTTAGEPWRAVRSAVLRASGDIEGADLQSSTINPAGLRPEERALLH